MADDIKVDIGTDSVDLLKDLNQATQALSQAVQKAQQFGQAFKNASTDVAALTKQMQTLQKQLKDAKTDADKLVAAQRIDQVQGQMAIPSMVVQQNRQRNAARQLASNEIMSSRTSDGRTLDQARLQNQAINAVITAMDTVPAQQAARLAAAGRKAAQRLIENTAAAIEAQINQANFRNIMRMRDFTGQGLDRSFVMAEARRGTQDRRFSEAFGMSPQQAAQIPPSELPRVLAEAAIAQRRLTEVKKDEERLQRQRNRALESGIREDFNAARKERERGIRIEERERERLSRERRVAERAGVKQDFDAARRERASQERAEQRELDRLRRQREAAERAGVRQDFTDARRERQLQERAQQREVDRLRRQRETAEAAGIRQDFDAARRQRLEEERAARRAATQARREAEPEFAARMLSRDDRFNRRFGIDRSEFEARTANASVRERVILLRELEARVKSAADAERRLNREQQQSARAAARPSNRDIAQRSMDINRERFNLNGGADLFGMQGRLLFNYALMGATVGGITALVREVVRLDDTLRKFQAITQTSNSELDGFRASLLQVAETSRFSVSELAQVSIQLGQTGLSSQEVAKALPAVAQFATAAGSTLTQATDILTATMGSFQLEAGRAREVVNVFTAALNQTRLSMEQLQLGMSYAANISREAGLTFTELTSSIASVAQAGVRSGSTIGTGLRQLIQDLIAPSDKLKDIFDDLGITMLDVDLKTNGLVGVLENLRNKGFGAAEALRGLDLRAAASFTALIGQLDVNKRLNESLLLTDAAAEASAIANESLSASLQRLGNNMVAMIDRGAGPALEAFKALVDGTTSLIQSFGSLSGIMPAVIAGLGSFATAITIIRVTSLIAGLAGLGTVLAGFAPVAIAGAAILGLTGISYAFSKVGNEAQNAARELDRMRGVTNELLSDENRVNSTLNSLDQEINRLLARRERLNSDALERRAAIIQAQQAFKEFGIDVSVSANSVDELIEALRRLRTELRGDLPQLLEVQQLSLQRQRSQMVDTLTSSASETLDTIDRARPSRLGRGWRPFDSANDRRREDARTVFGSDILRIFDLIENPNRIDVNDVNQSTASERRLLLDMRTAQQNRLVNLQNRGARPEVLDREREIIAYLDAIASAFEQTVIRVQGIQAIDAQDRVLEERRQGLALRNEPAVQQFVNDAEGLQARTRIALEKVQALSLDKSIGPMELVERFTAVKDELEAESQALLDRIPELREILATAVGATESQLAGLTVELEGIVAQFAGKDGGLMDDVQKEADKLRKALLQMDARSIDRQIEQQMTRARRLQTPEQLRVVEEYIQQLTAKRRDVERQLFEIDQKVRRGQMNQEQRLLWDQREQDLRDQQEKFGRELDDIRRQMIDAAFGIQTERLELERRGIEADIERLQRELENPRTTRERAQQLMEALNALFAQLTGVVQRGINVRTDQELFGLGDPQTRIAPLTGGRAETANWLISQLRGQGADERMINYALATAQRESSFNPEAVNPNSGASGLFQFMPRTWRREMGLDLKDIFDPAKQLEAFLRFTNTNKSFFNERMGRMPSEREMYLLHQQGRAGGTALMRNPGANAVDVLEPLYNNRRTAERAVTGNGGNVRMTAGEFAEVVMGMYDRSDRGVNIERRRLLDSQDAIERERRNAEDTARRAGQRQDAEANAVSRRLDLQTQQDIERRSLALSQSSNTQDAVRMIADLLNRQDERRSGLTSSFEFSQLSQEAQTTRLAEFDQQSRTEVQAQILQNARAIADATRRSLDDEVRMLQNDLERLQLAQERGAATDLEVAQAEKALRDAQLKRDTEGESKALQAEILAIQQQLAELTARGLSDTSEAVQLEARLLELARERAIAEERVANARQAAAAAPSMSGEMRAGAARFGQSRGFMDRNGEFLSDAVMAGQMLERTLGSVASAFDELFVNLVDGSMSAGEAFKKFALSVLQDMARMAAQALTNQIFKMILGAAGIGGGGGFSFGSLFGMAQGGLVPMAQGGMVRMAVGGGVPNRDSVPALLMPGEYVLRKSAVDAIGRGELDRLNQLPGVKSQATPMAPAREGEGGSTVNVWIVSEDQVPPPGPKDIVAVVSDNIQRGGSLKQLIRSVSTGQVF